MDHLFTGLVITILGFLIGLYVIMIRHINTTNIKLGEIYMVVNSHVAEKGIHGSEQDLSGLVESKVCVEVQKRNEVHFTQLQESMVKVDGKLDRLINKLL